MPVVITALITLALTKLAASVTVGAVAKAAGDIAVNIAVETRAEMMDH